MNVAFSNQCFASAFDFGVPDRTYLAAQFAATNDPAEDVPLRFFGHPLKTKVSRGVARGLGLGNITGWAGAAVGAAVPGIGLPAGYLGGQALGNVAGYAWGATDQEKAQRRRIRDAALRSSQAPKFRGAAPTIMTHEEQRRLNELLARSSEAGEMLGDDEEAEVHALGQKLLDLYFSGQIKK